MRGILVHSTTRYKPLMSLTGLFNTHTDYRVSCSLHEERPYRLLLCCGSYFPSKEHIVHPRIAVAYYAFLLAPGSQPRPIQAGFLASLHSAELAMENAD